MTLITRSDHTAPRAGEHAIVFGASMAGLLAARVLADSYDRVTVLDRDRLPDGVTENRKAVPQGRHAHGLQLGGQVALEQLLPGFRDETMGEGAPALRPGTEMRFKLAGNDIARTPVGDTGSVASRPLIEGVVRRRVRAIENVTVVDRCAVVDLLSADGRVTGVRAQDRAPGSEPIDLHADLVVAAVARTFFEVTGMLRPPTALLTPAIARRVLRRGAVKRPQQPLTTGAQATASA